MIIGTGVFDGRNNYILSGTFHIERKSNSEFLFGTSDDFYFENSRNTGTPAPGFALFRGDPTGMPIGIVAPIAEATDFLRIADSPVEVRGKQSAIINNQIDVEEFDTVFLWCFKYPMVLGVGTIIPPVGFVEKRGDSEV